MKYLNGPFMLRQCKGSSDAMLTTSFLVKRVSSTDVRPRISASRFGGHMLGNLKQIG